MKIRQFQIWIADLNPRMGTETGKIRPVLVVQTDLLNGEHPSTLVCPITTKIKPATEILRVHLKATRSGLREDSDIMVDQVRAIDNKRLLKKVGEVDHQTAQKMRENLRIVLDLD
ncbi:MAG: type II toxin-antitoxin system PemK/MazF family toxin [Cyclobacteriaceae bacterium]|nr:type II toxin-antitoxin system PemK/MazF family toxin [Cyclobacteriaceae bacterium]